MVVGVFGGRRDRVKRGSNRFDSGGRESAGISARSVVLDDLGWLSVENATPSIAISRTSSKVSPTALNPGRSSESVHQPSASW